ncbi:MAG: right-handed parallel beta-helix repeat-containing protein [Flavobacteriaceae bacterium]|nr:right-handed parallel beta-helix repeat-containing protein [Flavobacteriaceae bacterium]MBT5856901.1 right-handed parallel beta-helix repeat-containing protein [Flavobacteriaceae bacterium]
MKYLKKNKSFFPPFKIILFAIIVSTISFINRDNLYRSLVTINLGSIYVEYLNSKAELINSFNRNSIKTVSISMSSNNYVRMQTERAKMVSNYISSGDLWTGNNQYFKVKVLDDSIKTKGEIRLFGMNPDHYRNSNAHSFRIKFDGKTGHGSRKFNYLNPRSRDFITDPLLNIIYSKISKGIKINYDLNRVILNKENYGLLLKEDFFDKYLIEQNQRRESVIFEIYNDSLKFNHIGDNNEFEGLAAELSSLYENKYDEFIQKIDVEKLKTILLLSLIINDVHPIGDGNMHWYYNSVNGFIEPTIREGFVYKLNDVNIDDIVSSNKLINDIYQNKIQSSSGFISKQILDSIRNIIKFDSTYNSFKQKMIGFEKKISQKENLIFENIDLIENTLNPNIYNTNSDKKRIEIKNDTIISGEFIVNKNQVLIISKGVKLTLSNASIKIYGEFQAKGTLKKPIIIKGDKESGTIFINSNKPVLVDHVKFIGLTNLKSSHNQPSSITFYECNKVEIFNSSFSNNLKGDDYVNFFRSKNISLKNLVFKNVISDAIDSDFSDLKISNSKFINIGNDAIDGSGSSIFIYNNSFTDVKDKAISAGEESFFLIKDSKFIKNEIALVSKDGSTLISENNLLQNNRVDFTSFVKKKYHGPSKSNFFKTKISSYLIEKNSLIQGLDSILYSADVESKLYGNLYGRASQ